MNYSMIIYTLGYILDFEAAFLLLPGIVGLIFRESQAKYFFLCALIAAVLGSAMIVRKPKKEKIHAKEGFVVVALGWIVMSLVGALPFLISGCIPSFTDAVFETASGFTTTGASILPQVEALPKCMLFWRSFTHWIGGMGVLVFILAILPTAGADQMHLMRAESPGPSVDKLVPKLRETAKILYVIYFIMTIIEIILLLLGGMGMFDAVCLSFGTAGTGGFATRADGLASYNSYSQIVVTVFMFLFGINFKFYFLFLSRKWKDAFRLEEVRCYFLIYVAAVALITGSILKDVGSFGASLKHAAFQAASIMTTTGYATTDFNLWGTFPKIILLMLMVVGACAGSTGGGMKVSRIMLYVKQVRREVQNLIHPRSIKKIKMDNKTVGDETLRNANIFLMSYVLIIMASTLILSLDGYDFTTTVTSVFATLNNIGPGLELAGPMGGYGYYSILSKWVMIIDMIAGRLEIFPMLVLLAPSTWRKK
jgi:trk system potassium uptake protein TrkH